MTDEFALMAAFRQGRAVGQRDILVRLAELDASVRSEDRPTWTEIVANRIREMEICAREFAQRNGMEYREWAGGTAEEAAAWCPDWYAQSYDHAQTRGKGPVAGALTS